MRNLQTMLWLKAMRELRRSESRRLSGYLKLDEIEQLSLEGLLLGQVALEDGEECLKRLECGLDGTLHVL
jgi:hypothetical protein